MIANLFSLYLMNRLLHSQGRSIRDVIDFQRDRFGKPWAGIGIPSIGFGLQHFMLAASWQGALVYISSFFF